jgi:quinol monooxygenase YgiN
MSGTSPVAVLVKLRLRSEREAEFRSELDAVLQQVRAEPACLLIQGHQDPDDPTSFMLFEVWESREAFAEFEQGRSYLRDYMTRVRPWWSEPRDLTMWDQVA